MNNNNSNRRSFRVNLAWLSVIKRLYSATDEIEGKKRKTHVIAFYLDFVKRSTDKLAIFTGNVN